MAADPVSIHSSPLYHPTNHAEPASSPPLQVSLYFSNPISHGSVAHERQDSLQNDGLRSNGYIEAAIGNKRSTSTAQKPARKATMIPKSAEYILDSDDSDVPLAQVVIKSRRQHPRHSNANGPGDRIFQDDADQCTKVIGRRKSWTPIEADAGEIESKGFADLCKTFSFGDHILSTAVPTVPNKKRRITKVETAPKRSKETEKPGPPVNSSKKIKRPAKKAKTITALATAAYQVPSPTMTAEPVSAPAQLEAPMATTMPMPPPAKKPAKKTTRTANKAKASAKTKKFKTSRTAKAKEPERIYEPLLPPSQARRKLSNQAFLFGTSSQLQLDEPPETLHEIQQALDVSELVVSSPLLNSSQEHVSNITVPTAPHGTTLTAAVTQRNLWRVSARSTTNGMYKDDVRESQQSMVDSVIEEGNQELVLELSSDDPPDNVVNDERQDLMSIVHPSVTFSPAYIQPQRHRAALQPLNANQRLRSLSPPNMKSQFRAISTASEAADTTLSTPKRRGRPPKTISPSIAKPKATPPQSSPLSKWYCVDEIMDSDEASMCSPSPARRRASPPIAQLELAVDGNCGEIDAEDLPSINTNQDDVLWASVLPDVFAKITKTVRSTPRSESSTNLTWHEKMLLYDPIVIEDLTAWLNEQGVRVRLKVKAPAKKSKKDQGNAATSGDGACDHELAHWMVQKWCREHSICCLWKEGLRGGVRTKY